MSDDRDAAAKAAINAYFGEDCWDSLPEGEFDRWVAAIKHAVTPPPMTPDIREKAERLAREWFRGGHSGLADAISQALLEAHKAGREEMREEAAKVAKAFEDELLNMAEDDRFSRPATAKPSQDELRLAYRSATANDIATAIRSIK